MAVFLIAYALLVLLQASFAYSNGLASTEDVFWAGVRAVGASFITWAVVRLRRWAWWVAAVVSGLLVVVALLGVFALLASSLLSGPGGFGSDLSLDRRAMLLLAATLLSLVAALGTLIAGLIRNVVDSTDAILRTPVRLIGTVLLAVPLLAGALTVRAVRDPKARFGPVDSGQQAYPRARPGDSPAERAKGATPPGLQLPDGFGSITVDTERGRVLVSSPKADVVSVLDLEGRTIRRVEIPGGPGSLLVDGDRLYVVATTAARIAVLDASTFEALGHYGNGILVKPGPLVRAGGRLWTSTGECGRFGTALVSIDPGSGVAVVHPPIDNLRYCIDLAASPADPNLLLGYEPGLSPATLVRLDVSGSAPMVATSRRSSSLGNLRELAFLSSGDRFVAASGSPYEILEFRTADLAESGLSYPAEAYPASVATTPARGGMVAAGIDGAEGPDIFVSRVGDPSKRISTLELGPARTLIERSLAWSPDGSSLYALSSAADGQDVRFHLLKP